MRENNTAMEKQLWQEAWDALHEQYGSELPECFASRMKAEQELFMGTMMIKHLSLISGLEKQGICWDWQYVRYASLVAWLLQLTPVNPLPSHYRCPHCHRVELHPEVADGWDLPEKKCKCGTMMNRDGHDIPLYRYQKNFSEEIRYIDLTIAKADMKKLKQLITQKYGNDWRLQQYQYDGDDHAYADRLNEEGDRYILVPETWHPEFPIDNYGRLIVPIPEGIGHFIKSSDTILYVYADADRHPGSGKIMPDDSMGNAGSLYLSDTVLNDLLGRSKVFDAMIAHKRRNAPIDDHWGSIERIPSGKAEHVWKPELSSYSSQIVEVPCKDTDFDGKEIEAVDIHYPEADLTPWLPEKVKFSTIVYLLGLRYAFPRENMLDLLLNNNLKVTDIPANEEDLMKTISAQMEARGIHDMKLLWELVMPKEPNDSDGIQTRLSALGLPEWLSYLCMHGLDDKENLLKIVMIKLYKAGMKWTGSDALEKSK